MTLPLSERWRFPPYPLLIAVYPVLALAAKNASSLLSWLDLAAPLAIVLGIALATWAASGVFTRDPHRKAALTALAMTAFSIHGPIVREVLLSSPGGTKIVHVAVATVLTLSIVATVGTWVVRSRLKMASTSRFLNVTATILVIWSLLTLTLSISHKPIPLLTVGDIPKAGVASRHPDIFVLVLDKYTGARSLAAHYDFDNGDFEDRLRRRGFSIPRASRTNYVHTFLALPALLNFRYLDDLPRILGSDAWDQTLTKPLIEDSRSRRLLKALGYRFVFFNTTFTVTASNPHADRQLPGPPVIGQFSHAWLRETPLAWLLEAMCRLHRCQRFPYTAESAEQIEWKFSQLAQLADRDAPMFVLAHLLVPHEPYLFRADCSHREPYWPPHDVGEEEAKVKAAYIEQIICVNRKIEQLVESLLARSNAPIVILQSDHGHGRLGRTQPDLSAAPRDNVRERLDIFAAYYLPDGGAAHIYDTISPVNVLRVVFNHYFGTDLPILPDRSYWSSSAKPFIFTPVD